MDAAAYAFLASGFGAAIALTGAAMGIGKLAAAALEGSARQPEALGGLRVSMIIAAALIEGLGFFALIVCLLLGFKLSKWEMGNQPTAKTEFINQLQDAGGK
jgi:F-type H+-transporting ATPase subunit c